MSPVVVSNVSEANHISKEESGRARFGRAQQGSELLRCLLLMGSAYLTVYCNRAFCSDQPAEGPVGSTSTAQSAAVAG